MSPLVVMMLMVYVLLIALCLTVWSVLTLGGSRRADAYPADAATRGGRGRSDNLPPVPPAFAAKPGPSTERSEPRPPRTERNAGARRDPSGPDRTRQIDPRTDGHRHSGRDHGRTNAPRDEAGDRGRTPADRSRPATAGNDDSVSRSGVRVTVRTKPKEEPKPEKPAGTVPEDAFERFRTADDEIDF